MSTITGPYTGTAYDVHWHEECQCSTQSPNLADLKARFDRLLARYEDVRALQDGPEAELRQLVAGIMGIEAHHVAKVERTSDPLAPRPAPRPAPAHPTTPHVAYGGVPIASTDDFPAEVRRAIAEFDADFAGDDS